MTAIPDTQTMLHQAQFVSEAPAHVVRHGNRESVATNPIGRASNAKPEHADEVNLSPQAVEASEAAAKTTADAGTPTGTDGEPLSEAEQKQVEELKQRDREVRQHEQAHKAAAGQYATSGPTYSYQTGPDGKRYAVGGSVGIDLSPEDTPEATIQKMAVVRRAAMAPAEPSSQDRAVAAQASQIASEARQELARERAADAKGDDDSEVTKLDVFA